MWGKHCCKPLSEPQVWFPQMHTVSDWQPKAGSDDACVVADPQLWRQAGPAGHERLAQLLYKLGRKGALHELSLVLLTASSAPESSSGPADGLASARGGIASTSAPARASTTNPSGPTTSAVAAFAARYIGVVPPGDALVVTQLLCTPFLWSR